MLDNDYLELAGVGGVPVRLGSQGWTEVIDLGLAEDEVAALRRAFNAVAAVSAAVQAS
jgi:malate/lactate dehydrogenase